MLTATVPPHQPDPRLYGGPNAAAAGTSELGVNPIDTAGFYGPKVADRPISGALHPLDLVYIGFGGGPGRALSGFREEGEIRHLEPSNVALEEVEEARKIAPVVAVQNLYNLADRPSKNLLQKCEQEGIAFVLFFLLATGELARPGGGDRFPTRGRPLAGGSRLAADPLAGGAVHTRHLLGRPLG